MTTTANSSPAAGEAHDLVRVREADLRPTVQAIFEALGATG